MERLEVAYVLTEMLNEVEQLNIRSEYNNSVSKLRYEVSMIISRHVGKYWWGCVGSGMNFEIVRNYTDKVFELVPSRKLQAFIDYVFEDKLSADLIPALMRRFPLEMPRLDLVDVHRVYNG